MLTDSDFLTKFKKSNDIMIAANDKAYSNLGRGYFSDRSRKYSEADIKNILSSGSEAEAINLSRVYFSKNGFYKRIILYYATLLKYSGILIPSPAKGKKMSENCVSKIYYEAVESLDRMPLKDFFTECSRRVLVDGFYYGIKRKIDKTTFSVINLSPTYCRTRFVDEEGRDVLEFDLNYFRSITDEATRREALKNFPSFLSKAFRSYDKGKRTSSWIAVPSSMGGICFGFNGTETRPIFLDVIASILDYDQAIETEQRRDAEEIKKIIVQKVPHLSDGQLLFEPEEAAEMHDGAVKLMRGNPNISVLTTYTDVDTIVSKTTADNASSTMERMLTSIYNEAGVSSQIFASNNNMTLSTALKNDLALMMVLAEKYSRFVTDIVNSVFGNGNIKFKYKILPVTYYNESEYIEDSFKLASSGYSFLVPAIAAGFSQNEILHTKDLENELLNLVDKFKPLSSSYTQSGEGAGRPELAPEQKSEKTAKNEEALAKQGG